MFGNMGNSEAVLTIDKRAIKIAAGSGGPHLLKGPKRPNCPRASINIR